MLNAERGRSALLAGDIAGSAGRRAAGARPRPRRPSPAIAGSACLVLARAALADGRPRRGPIPLPQGDRSARGNGRAPLPRRGPPGARGGRGAGGQPCGRARAPCGRASAPSTGGCCSGSQYDRRGRRGSAPRSPLPGARAARAPQRGASAARSSRACSGPSSRSGAGSPPSSTTTRCRCWRHRCSRSTGWRAAPTPTPSAASRTSTRRTLAAATDRTRRLMFELRPPQGLAKAVRELASQAGHEADLDVEVSVPSRADPVHGRGGRLPHGARGRLERPPARAGPPPRDRRRRLGRHAARLGARRRPRLRPGPDRAPGRTACACTSASRRCSSGPSWPAAARRSSSTPGKGTEVTFELPMIGRARQRRRLRSVAASSMRSTPRRSRPRAMMSRWISEVPSQIRSTRSSRRNRSAADVRM